MAEVFLYSMDTASSLSAFQPGHAARQNLIAFDYVNSILNTMSYNTAQPHYHKRMYVWPIPGFSFIPLPKY